MTVDELERCIGRLLAHLRSGGITTVDTGPYDYYWTVISPEWLDMEGSPELAVGSLVDDLAELQKLQLEPGRASAVDLDRVAAILRLLSDQLCGMAQDAGSRARLVLFSRSGSLAFDAHADGVGDWCQVHVLASGVRRLLGAEGLQVLAGRLAAFLADASPAQRWIFSVSEPHGAAYGEHFVDRVIISFQDHHGNMFAALTLTPTEVLRWRLALAAIAARDHRAR